MEKQLKPSPITVEEGQTGPQSPVSSKTAPRSDLKTTKLARRAGMAAVLGSVLLALVTVVETVAYGDLPVNEAMTHQLWIPATVLFLVGLALVTLGLMGMYARQSEQAGALGSVAFLTAFAGMLMVFGFTWLHTFLLPALATTDPEGLITIIDSDPPPILIGGFLGGLLLFDLGWLLVGMASLRARVFPRGAAVLLIIGAMLDFVFAFLDVSIAVNGIVGLVLIAAVAWMGVTLWSEKPKISAAAS